MEQNKKAVNRTHSLIVGVFRKGRLVSVSRLEKGKRFLIGSKPGSRVFLPLGGVARQHAHIILHQDGGIFLENVDASLETYFQDQKIDSRVELIEGDYFRIGDYELQLHIHEEKVEELPEKSLFWSSACESDEILDVSVIRTRGLSDLIQLKEGGALRVGDSPDCISLDGETPGKDLVVRDKQGARCYLAGGCRGEIYNSKNELVEKVEPECEFFFIRHDQKARILGSQLETQIYWRNKEDRILSRITRDTDYGNFWETTGVSVVMSALITLMIYFFQGKSDFELIVPEEENFRVVNRISIPEPEKVEIPVVAKKEKPKLTKNVTKKARKTLAKVKKSGAGVASINNILKNVDKVSINIKKKSSGKKLANLRSRATSSSRKTKSVKSALKSSRAKSSAIASLLERSSAKSANAEKAKFSPSKWKEVNVAAKKIDMVELLEGNLGDRPISIEVARKSKSKRGSSSVSSATVSKSESSISPKAAALQDSLAQLLESTDTPKIVSGKSVGKKVLPSTLNRASLNRRIVAISNPSKESKALNSVESMMQVGATGPQKIRSNSVLGLKDDKSLGRSSKYGKSLEEFSKGLTAMGDGLDKGAIARVVRAYLGRIKRCYERQLIIDPKLSGKITANWTIGSDGRVKEVKYVKDTMGNSGVTRCVVNQIRAWKFPKPRGGGKVIVTYPFLFHSLG